MGRTSLTSRAYLREVRLERVEGDWISGFGCPTEYDPFDPLGKGRSVRAVRCGDECRYPRIIDQFAQIRLSEEISLRLQPVPVLPPRRHVTSSLHD